MKKSLIAIFLFNTLNAYSAQEKISISSEQNKNITLQVGAFSNLPNLEIYKGIESVVWSGHRYNIINMEGYTMMKVINYTSPGDTFYFHPTITGLEVGAYPMYAETRITIGSKVYMHEVNRTLNVKPFPYD